MAMKNYWKRFAELVIALKRRPFLSARIKLTALYILNAIIILGVFAAVLGYLQLYHLQTNLAGMFARGVDGEAVVARLYKELQTSTATLVVLALGAIGILSYVFVYITLKSLRAFVDNQRRFISDASHELRTPLATVKTENEVALLDPDNLSREEAVSILRSNVEEIDRINTILNNLLNLASFASATGAPPKSAVDLSLAAGRILERLRMLAERKKLRLYGSSLPTALVWANPTALEEIISNLLKNAIQYTASGGEVELSVRLRSKDKQAELVVRDTGVGISPQDLPYVFEPFYRSEKSLHMYQQGTGLGLPLVREIVRRHGGEIDIQSEVGAGTRVIVLIPLAPPNSVPATGPHTDRHS
jgi:signal transduction histidine kinase